MITREQAEQVAKKFNLKIYPKTLTVDIKQRCGSGMFARVYRISPRRVIKIFKTYGQKNAALEFTNFKDEIRGALMFKKCLPIYGIQRVRFYDRHIKRMHTTYGLIKRYLTPLRKCDRTISQKIMDSVQHSYGRFWDKHIDNFGIDSRGQWYLLDTGTQVAFKKVYSDINDPWSY